MALTNTPAWPQTPRYEAAGTSVANLNTNGSGTIATAIVAGPNGTRLTGLYVGATATVADTAVRFFLSADGGASWTYLPHLDALVPAHTFDAATVNGGRTAVVDQADPARYLDLPGDARLGFAIAVGVSGGEMIVEALGADY